MSDNKTVNFTRKFCHYSRDHMNEIVKGVAIAVLTTGIVAALGYVFLIKENQVKLEYLEKGLNRIESSIKSSSSSIDAIKLFVVAAHPNRNYLPISSSEKLGKLNPNELTVFAQGLSNINYQPGSELNLTRASKEFIEIKAEYDFNDTDIKKIIESLDSELKTEYFVHTPLEAPLRKDSG
jgi:hypothetical protein